MIGTPRTVLSLSAALTIIAALLSGAAPTWAITIDTVPVGNVGNANDPATGKLYGAVNYEYRIGKYEVTAAQYAAFLNAVAATDTYNLYNISMGHPIVAEIARFGSPGGYTYSAMTWSNHPITYISWGDAARFANWLHNGQPTGGQNASTTEDGAYALNGATSAAALFAVVRKPNARWFIPSESEWYKAAYHQPAEMGGDADSYWRYPMRTNTEPYSDQPPGTTPDNSIVGNFFGDDSIANGYDDGYAASGSPTYSLTQNYLTDVGAYSFATSYYGTFDQGGNVNEFTEGVIGTGSRAIRGGSWYEGAFGANPFGRGPIDPTSDVLSLFGFRLGASVPEPGTATLVVIAVGIAAVQRQRRVVVKSKSERLV